jgi:multidrug efflux system membrane fusion protein
LARVEAVQARLTSAEINLDYAHIKAPISGRISRAEIKEGNLVEAGPNAPVLTSIVSKQKVYADFEVDEKSYLKYVRSSARSLNEESKIPVKLSLSEDEVEYEGFIHSFDNQIDVSSGTIRARALFDNEDSALLPGMFANVKMGTPSSIDQIIISERAIGTDQSRKFVYVVNDQNLVEYRVITIGESMNGQRVVTSGLNDGDKVIVEGIIRIRPGMPVAPQSNEQAVALTEQSE